MLRKHLIRYLFKNNKWMLVAICSLIVILSFLFFSLSFMNNSYNQINSQLKAHNQEQFQFFPHVLDGETISEAVTRIEAKYNMKSELQAYKQLTFNSYKVKLIKQTELINQLIFVEGQQHAIADLDIVYDINTAKMLNKFEADNQFSSYGFKKAGIAIFPSQLTPNMNIDGFEVYNPENAYIGAVSKSTYDTITADEKIVFSGLWNVSAKTIDKGDFVFFIDAADNNELNGIHAKLSMNKMIVVLSTGVLSVIVLMMIFMLIYKMIKDNEQYFGILKSIGYNNKQFYASIVPFFLTFIVPIILGFFVSSIVQERLFNYMNSNISIPYYAANNGLFLFLLVCFVLVFSLILLSTITLFFLLRKQPILLILGNQEQKTSKLKRMLLNGFNRLKGITRLQLKFLFSHSFVLFLTLFTGFAIGVQLLLSFSLYQFPDKLLTGLEKQFLYRYHLVFDKALNDSEVLNQIGLAYGKKSVQLDQGNTITDLSLYVLKDPTKQELIQFKQYGNEKEINEKLNKGIIISKWLANKYNLQQGDIVQVDDGAGHLYNFQISAIHIGLQGNELYTSSEYYKKMTNESELMFNGIFTNSKSSSAGSFTVIEQREVIEAARKTVDRFNVFSLFIFIIGIILGVILFVIALYVVMQNGQKHMLLLKTIGYTNKQVSRITIEGYLFVLLIGILISIPYLSMLSSFLFDMLSRASSFYLPIVSTLPQVILLIVFTVIFFYSIAIFYMYQVSKLKNYSLLINE